MIDEERLTYEALSTLTERVANGNFCNGSHKLCSKTCSGSLFSQDWGM